MSSVEGGRTTHHHHQDDYKKEQEQNSATVKRSILENKELAKDRLTTHTHADKPSLNGNVYRQEVGRPKLPTLPSNVEVARFPGEVKPPPPVTNEKLMQTLQQSVPTNPYIDAGDIVKQPEQYIQQKFIEKTLRQPDASLQQQINHLARERHTSPEHVQKQLIYGQYHPEQAAKDPPLQQIVQNQQQVVAQQTVKEFGMLPQSAEKILQSPTPELKQAIVKAAEQQGKSTDQVKGELLSHIQNGTTPKSSELATLFRQVSDHATQEAVTTFLSQGQTAQTTGRNTYDANVKNTFKEQVEGHIKLSGLSAKQKKQILLAMNDPKMRANLDPVSAKVLQEAESQAFKFVQQKLGVPNGLLEQITAAIADPDGVEMTATDMFDSAFKEALKEMAGAKGLPPDVVAKLKRMHFFPKGSFPDAAKLKELFQQLDETAHAQVIQALGLPAGTAIKPGSKDYQILAAGEYRKAIAKFLDGVKPPLSKEQKAQMMAALTNPDVKLPENLQAILMNAKKSALSAVQAKMGLPEGFVPDLSMLGTRVNVDFERANASIAAVKNIVETATEVVKLMPATTDKIPYLDAMKAISDAMIELSEFLFLLTAKDSNMGKKMGKMRLSSELGRLEKQRQAIEERREAIEDAQKAGSTMEIIGPIIVALTVVAAVCIAPFAPGLAVVMLIMAVLMATGAIEKLSKAIMEALPEDMAPWLKSLLTVIIVLIIMAPLAIPLLFNPGGWLAFGLMVASTAVSITATVMMTTRFWQNLLLAFGVEDAIAQEIFALIMMIIMMIVAIALGMGGGFAAMGTKGSAIGSMSTTLGTGLESVTSLMQHSPLVAKLLMGAAIAAETASGALQSAVLAVQIKSELAQAKAALQIAALEAYLKEVEALIAIFRQVIDDILNGLSSVGQWAKNTNKQQSDMWRNLSDATTNLHNATQG